MKNLLIFLLLLSISILLVSLNTSIGRAKIFSQVSSQSFVKWKGWHLGKTGERYGKIRVEKATLQIKKNRIKKGEFIIDMSSLSVENFKNDTTMNEKLKAHLMGSDFFETDSFPQAHFSILSVQDTIGDFNSIIVGNLTLKNKTHIVSFLTQVDISPDSVSIFSEPFEINRNHWGISFNNESTKGVPIDYLIMNAVELQIDANFFP